VTPQALTDTVQNVPLNPKQAPMSLQGNILPPVMPEYPSKTGPADAKTPDFEALEPMEIPDHKSKEFVDSLIRHAESLGASDIHIKPKRHHTVVRLRIDGVLHVVTAPLAIGPTTDRIVQQIKTRSNMKIEERAHPQDGRFSVDLEGGRQLDLRSATLPTIYGEKMTLRLFNDQRSKYTLEQLGMRGDNLERYLEAIHLKDGCAIVTGPTGSGKSTTLYSSIQRVISPDLDYASIEDPVEFQIESLEQIDASGHGSQRITFAEALKAIMRSDPDVILVGEVRDHETAAISIEAALTGHYIFTTLHTNDALSSVTRMGRLQIDPYLTAEAVKVFVAQRLIRLLCPECKEAHRAEPDVLRDMGVPEEQASGGLQLYKARKGGCEQCHGYGYKGRAGIFEVVCMTEQLKKMITSGASYEEMKKLVRSEGMGSLRDDAFARVRAGETSLEQLATITISS